LNGVPRRYRTSIFPARLPIERFRPRDTLSTLAFGTVNDWSHAELVSLHLPRSSIVPLPTPSPLIASTILLPPRRLHVSASHLLSPFFLPRLHSPSAPLSSATSMNIFFSRIWWREPFFPLLFFSELGCFPVFRFRFLFSRVGGGIRRESWPDGRR